MNENKVELVPINESDFRTYIEAQIREYANEKVKAGSWCENEAHNLANESLLELLPGGRETPGHAIMTITDATTRDKVGVIWVQWENIEHRSSYIWDIRIYEKFRRNGYGTFVLKSLEKMVKERGSNNITLHVFGHNKVAISLYRSLGYSCTDIIMKKEM
ncbi:MAG: GNAT family N-acetyltransferase [Thermoplasmataceae archaeon]